MYYLILLMAFTILLTQQAYGAILAVILFIGFYEIVVVNKNYKFMKEFIEMFF